ncbi:MAG: hypothetical protein L6Q98_09000 [Anaerolineae bacterium]|nr:hypothetical protein [Anaerolineae bacterium]NUQ03847.1 hypothetical protein [Anaerolineae bacterium]
MFRRLQPHHTITLEAGIIGLFFIQAARLLIPMIYSRAAGASVVTALQAASAILPDPLPVDPALVTGEMTLVGAFFALPLVGSLLMHLPIMPLITALLVIAGRLLMFDLGIMTPTVAAGLTVSAGLFYLLTTARHRLRSLPYMFALGFSADMLIRMVGNTVDLSLVSGYLNVQIALSVAAALLALISLLLRNRAARADDSSIAADRGLIPLWGALGLSGQLFLWLALFGLPNAVAARAGVDYTLFAPAILGAALLPIIPAVRGWARGFIGAVDGGARGWLWLLLIALLIVLGTRLSGLVAGVSLTAAALLSSLLWWWIARPKGEKERSLGGVYLLIGMVLFGMLIVGDSFTFEYAFVRDFTGDFAFLNPYVPPLLRGFRGFGLGLLLLALFIAAIPMVQTRRRIPWAANASPLVSLLAILIVAGVVVGAVAAVRPPVIVGVRGAPSIRVATYNIHGGYDQYYVDQLEGVARTIQQSGANVVLLQEVEAGRLASSGIDQSLWLARRLGMDRRYFGTNEALQGLAVLSNIEIAFADGDLLPSLGSQTGVQRVQIVPDQEVVLTVYNTWLSPLFDFGDGAFSNQEQDQQQQISRVLGSMIGGNACSLDLGRAVLGGTMHNVPDSPLLQTVRSAGFSDPFAGLPIEVSATFARQGQPRARFDYLLLCNLPSEGVGVLNTEASDHRIAYAGVVLTR